MLQRTNRSKPIGAMRHLINIKHRTLLWGFCLGLLGLTTTAGGQPLSELQWQAVRNRPLIQKYRLSLESAQREIAYKRGQFWPILDLGYRANALNEATPFEPKKNSHWGGTISYNLFNGFRDHYNLAAAKHAEKIKAYALAGIAQDLQLSIAIVYLDLFEKKTFLKIVEDQLALIEKRRTDTQSRFEVGLVSKNEVLRLTVEKNEILQKQRQAEANVEKSRNQLAFATNTSIQMNNLLFKEFELLPNIDSFEILKENMLQNRSELKALKATVALLTEDAQAARSGLWPSADIAASYNRFGDDFYPNKYDEYRDENRIQLNLNINLFDGFQKYERIKQKELAVEQARLDLTELENQLITELNNRIIDLNVAKENLTVAQSAIAQAEENVRITEEASKAGVETATDMLNAILNLSTARFNRTSARNNVFRNHFFLQRTIDGFTAEVIEQQ